MRNPPPQHISLFGASPDTQNQGVTALCHAVISHLHSRGVPRVTVFDHGRGVRRDVVSLPSGPVPVERCGAVLSRRFYRLENWWNIRLAAALGGSYNPAAVAMRSSDAIYDVSAGDSFTDLYGEYRFQSILAPKQLALSIKRPLVLLPQTYGPFRSRSTRTVARSIVERAHMAWARDADGFAALKDLLGNEFDPARHRLGVDMAFALPPCEPQSLSATARHWLIEDADGSTPMVGVNVSGLIFNQPDEAKSRYGLKADYKAVVQQFVGWLLTQTNARVVLIPHVLVPAGNPESDSEAINRLVAEIAPQGSDRILVVPPTYSPSELKWLIGRLDWFVGTRMHSTIAALGSGVPSASLSYSLKTRGVFETCQQAHNVFELRHEETGSLVEMLQQAFARREQDRAVLQRTARDVSTRSREQLDEILDSLSPLPNEAHSARPHFMTTSRAGVEA